MPARRLFLSDDTRAVSGVIGLQTIGVVQQRKLFPQRIAMFHPLRISDDGVIDRAGLFPSETHEECIF